MAGPSAKTPPPFPATWGFTPGLINIAVKDLAPGAAAGNADPVIETVKSGEMHDHQHVLSFAFDPAMKGQDTILIVDVDHAETLSAQTRVAPTQREQLAREAKVIEHLLVAGVEPAQSSSRSWRLTKSSDHCLSSKNSCPMKSIGMPGAVSPMPVATRARLRPNHERGSSGCPSRATRSSRPSRTMS